MFECEETVNSAGLSWIWGKKSVCQDLGVDGAQWEEAAICVTKDKGLCQALGLLYTVVTEDPSTLSSVTRRKNRHFLIFYVKNSVLKTRYDKYFLL